MTRQMNTMPTIRRGRTHFNHGPADKRGVLGVLSILIIIALLVAPPILLLHTESARHSRYMALSSAIDSDIVELNRNGDLNGISGALAHGTSSSIDTISTDPFVGISIPGAMTLKRNTQYCQWSEVSSRHCQKCTRSVRASDGSSKTETYDCNCVTHYDYVKAWRDYRINSLLFDQPGAHHNPQRDPLPSTTFLGDATLTLNVHGEQTHSEGLQVHLHPSLLQNGVRFQPSRNVDFVPNGRAPPISFFGRIYTYFFGPDTTRYEPLNLLRDTTNAMAATQHNFVYVGQGGYFFSPYKNPSTTQMLFNYFVQYMEGSLFDWQLGDLMPSCTAGDIRFSYSVQDPESVSFLGEVHGREITPREVIVGNNRESIGFVHAGHRSAEDMIVAEDSASRNTALMFRALLLLWSVPAGRLMGVALGREVGDSSTSTQFTATVGLFATLLSTTWILIWGTDVGSRDTVLLFVMGSYFGFLAMRSSVRRGRGRWWNGVWCRIGMWAYVPPEWRVEDSYVPEPVDGPDSKRL